MIHKPLYTIKTLHVRGRSYTDHFNTGSNNVAYSMEYVSIMTSLLD